MDLLKDTASNKKVNIYKLKILHTFYASWHNGREFNEGRDGMRRARYIAMKGWIVEEKRESGWVRIYQGLPKHEAYWAAYGENI